MKNETNRKIGAILHYLQMFVAIAVSIVYVPFMLGILGQSTYGIYSTCTSTIAYLNLLALGFGSSYMRYYTRSTKKLDGITVEEFNWQYMIMFLLFGVIALIFGLVISQNAFLVFNETFSSNDIKLAQKLMFILSFSMATSITASVFSSYISCQQKFIFLKSVNIIKTVLSPSLSFFFLLAGYGSIGMVIVTTLTNFAADLVNIWFCMKKLNMKFKVCGLNGKFIKGVASFSVFIGINQVAYQLNFSADKIVLSKVVNVSEVAIYSVGATLNTYFEQIGSSIGNLFDSEINKIIISEKSKEIKDAEINAIFFKVGRVQFTILMLIFSGFIFFGKFFIDWWVGVEYTVSYYITILLMASLIIPLVQNTALYIQRAKYKHKFRSLLILTTALINILISIFLAKIYGAIGSAIGTTLILFLSSLILNVYYYKIIDLDIIKFWKEILIMTKGLIAPMLLGILVNIYFPVTSFKVFVEIVFSYVCVYILSMYAFAFNKYEKKLLNNIGNKLLKEILNKSGLRRG